MDLLIWFYTSFDMILLTGQITEYKLYHNEVLVYNGMLMTYQLSGLTPYSLHTFRVVACTIKGCASSLRTEGRTKEAPPEGFIVMDVKVADARTVRVKWNAPEKPYGLIYYDVYFYGKFYADPGMDLYESHLVLLISS